MGFQPLYLDGSVLALNSSSNANVGIGTATPNNILNIYSASTAPILEIDGDLNGPYENAQIRLKGFTNTGPSWGGNFDGYGMRGTLASPSPTKAGDRLAGFGGGGFTNAYSQESATIAMMAASDWNASSAESYMKFTTTPINSVSQTERMRITSNGNIGIGTTAPQYLLSVNGSIGTKEVIVTGTGWSDYVFKPDYRLKPLSEVAAYIAANHHLPEIPSESEVLEKGVSVGEMQAKLLAKVEELTLHMIRAEEENKALRERIARLEGNKER